MKRLFALLLAMTMTISLTGCSKDKEKPLTPPEENFEADEMEEEEPDKEETAEPEHDPAVAQELEGVSFAYNGVIRAMYQPDISKDGVSYVPSDSQFFWLAIYFTAAEAGTITEDITFDEKTCTFTIPAAIVQEYAAANFGSTQSLPEIPQEITYIKADGENYMITVSDLGDTHTRITKAYKNNDDSYTAFVDFSTSEDLIASYKISFRENTEEDALFKYQITDAVLVK